MTGRTISHYKILEKLGSGGMGEVWKAEDLKLGRQVALKFLASHLVSDPEVRKRFEREAKAAASLSHPNICYVHEIDEADGKSFLAMELVEGEGLDERIGKGPLPLGEGLDLAQQIADGLQAAHEKGVVHRDIKPGNIIITPDGRAKILDFGLALLTEGSKLTKLDTTVGTVAYMSPEQSQGAEVDHRTDIWALGCILYEMVCGQRPFQGTYDQAVVYSIVNEPPEPLTALRTGVPLELELLVDKCLAKDAAQRFQTTADLIVDLETLREKLKSGRSTILRTTSLAAGGPATAAQPPQPQATTVQRSTHRLVLALLAVATLALLAVSFTHFTEPLSQDSPVIEMAAAPLPGGAQPGQLSVSPDGRHLAATQVPSGSLWVRSLDSVEWSELSRAGNARYPFWSPDSAEIGFFADGKLMKVALAGGPSQAIADAAAGSGGSWSSDGVILFTPVRFGQIFRVAASGGDPIPVTEEGEAALSHRFPHFLPDGQHFLYQVSGASPEQTGVYLGSLGGEAHRRLLPDGSNAIYVRGGRHTEAGFLLFVRERTLMAQPFDLSRLELSDGPVALLVSPQLTGDPGFFGFSASLSGVLAYSTTSSGGQRRLAWVDRAGRVVERTDVEVDNGVTVALSPDGRRVAYNAVEGGNRDVWIYDFARDTRIRLSDQPGPDSAPVWSPDSKQVAFASTQSTTFSDVFVGPADGSSAPEALVSEVGQETPTDWSHDGRFILYDSRGGDTLRDLWLLERTTAGDSWEARPFLSTLASERHARLSPDGRYVAYRSDESGQREVYVQPFPDGGRKTAISSSGGGAPRWSRDGNELFYVASDGTLVAVEVSTEGDFSVGDATRLFQVAGLTSARYDVSVDGQRFLVTEALVDGGDGEIASDSSVRLIVNWPAKFLPEQ